MTRGNAASTTFCTYCRQHVRAFRSEIHMNTNDTIALGIGMVFLLSIIPIVGGFMYARRGLLLTHAERMKALELGAELPDHAAAARIRAALGQSTADDDGGRDSLAQVFLDGRMGGLLGIRGRRRPGRSRRQRGGRLRHRVVRRRDRRDRHHLRHSPGLAPAPIGHDSNNNAKLATEDADAFDVVSCRG